jgi:tetratricopeptide (TPR) repeat protein
MSFAAPASPQATRRAATTQTVSRFAFEHLDKARKLLERQEYAEAIVVLNEMLGRRGLSDRERALMWQTYGYVYGSQQNYQRAADSFEKCLRAGGLGERAAANVTYNLAQLYVLLERYDQAIELLVKWLQTVEKPPPSAEYLIAVAYARDEQLDAAIPHAERAVAQSSAPQEAWLRLLFALYVEKKRPVDAIGALEELVRRYPRKLYWKQLSGMHAELGDENRALAVLELAYLDGRLSEARDLLDLAGLYLRNDLPFKAALTVREGLNSGVIEPSTESWQLLADSLIRARERREALDPLRKAAELSANGELYVRVARLNVHEEEWDEAIKALQHAFEKGGLRDTGRAYLLLGIAHAHGRNWEEAEWAFGEARSSEDTKPAATQWMAQLQQWKTLRDIEGARTRPPKREIRDSP